MPRDGMGFWVWGQDQDIWSELPRGRDRGLPNCTKNVWDFNRYLPKLKITSSGVQFPRWDLGHDTALTNNPPKDIFLFIFVFSIPTSVRDEGSSRFGIPIPLHDLKIENFGMLLPEIISDYNREAPGKIKSHIPLFFLFLIFKDAML